MCQERSRPLIRLGSPTCWRLPDHPAKRIHELHLRTWLTLPERSQPFAQGNQTRGRDRIRTLIVEICGQQPSVD